MPFIGINIDDFADKTRKFTGYLLHSLDGQIVLVLQVHASCRIPGRLSLNKCIDFFKTEALNKNHIQDWSSSSLQIGKYYSFSPISTAIVVYAVSMREKKFITSGSVLIQNSIFFYNPRSGGLTARWKPVCKTFRNIKISERYSPKFVYSAENLQENKLKVKILSYLESDVFKYYKK